MSEHQVVAFRAIDGPVSTKDLKFMQKQSSRAEITPWTFDNEYHYGDFHGDAEEMLRRGYDLHLHYANFGTRTLMIRLPNGLPDKKAAAPYLTANGVQFVKDKQGAGGILSISPFHEPDDLDEIWEVDELLEELLPLRAEILNGDLRPLYLAHLAMACDQNHPRDKTKEAPVPAGLEKLTPAQTALAELYEIGDYLIAAAAQQSPPLPSVNEPRTDYAGWLEGQPTQKKDEWLAQLMADPNSSVRKEILAKFRQSTEVSVWPTVPASRTIAELLATEADLFKKAKQKKDKAAELARARKRAAMVADPAPTLLETERLAAIGGTDSFNQAATLLAELREAIRGTTHDGLAEQQAAKLRDKHPTMNRLIAALRRQGFLPKK